MLSYKELEDTDLPKLKEFCFACAEHKLLNNASIETLKISDMKAPFGKYWVICEGSRIVGISGCHHLPEISKAGYRILYRSCMLPEFRVSNTKSLFKNISVHEPIFKHLAPLQIAWAKSQGATEFFITTNSEKDEPWKEKMLQTHRILGVLNKQKIVSLHLESATLYNCRQSVWRLNEPNFWSERSRNGLSSMP